MSSPNNPPTKSFVWRVRLLTGLFVFLWFLLLAAMVALVVNAIIGWTRYGFGFYQIFGAVMAALVGVQLRMMFRMFTRKPKKSARAGS